MRKSYCLNALRASTHSQRATSQRGTFACTELWLNCKIVYAHIWLNLIPVTGDSIIGAVGSLWLSYTYMCLYTQCTCNIDCAIKSKYLFFWPNSSYGDYGLSSSESIDLTFHSESTVTHNRLTVDTMAPTQMEPSHERRGYAAQEGEEYFDRLDSKRYL